MGVDRSDSIFSQVQGAKREAFDLSLVTRHSPLTTGFHDSRTLEAN
jgi:hypothetical protein